MSSDFSRGDANFNFAGGFTGRSVSPINPQVPFRSHFNGILIDPVSKIIQQRSDLMGKRSLGEFQVHHLQRQKNSLFQFQPQPDQRLSLYHRNVKQRIFQQPSPVNSDVGMTPGPGLSILQHQSRRKVEMDKIEEEDSE